VQKNKYGVAQLRWTDRTPISGEYRRARPSRSSPNHLLDFLNVVYRGYAETRRKSLPRGRYIRMRACKRNWRATKCRRVTKCTHARTHGSRSRVSVRININYRRARPPRSPETFEYRRGDASHMTSLLDRAYYHEIPSNKHRAARVSRRIDSRLEMAWRILCRA